MFLFVFLFVFFVLFLVLIFDVGVYVWFLVFCYGGVLLVGLGFS